MRIDGNSVTPGTARKFAAIGGGHGVKMDLARRKGESSDAAPREFLFGSFTEVAAAQLVARLNGIDHGAFTSASLTAGTPEPERKSA